MILDSLWTKRKDGFMDGHRRRADRVLVVGDANPDLVLRGDVVPRFGQAEHLLDAADLLIGGSAGIAAHAFARLGRSVSLLAAVGADALGAQQRSELAAAGVDVNTMLERPDTATGITVILSRGNDRAIFTFPGAIPTLTGDEILAAIDGLPGVGHLHLASLYLQPQLLPVLPGVLAAARDRGCTVSLDTNDDPAGSWSGMPELLPHVDVLLPNEREAVALAGGLTDDVLAAAAELARLGPLVVVKDGARGAHAVTPAGKAASMPGRQVDVIDTTGAGDTFDAAFLDAWLSGVELEACLRRGIRAGARSVGAAGGTAGQPSRADLDPDADNDQSTITMERY
jgi:ribokinase